jgi:hypothetical protein
MGTGTESKFNMPEPKRGDPVSAKVLRQIVSGALNSLVGGAGISVKQVNDKVVIENTYTQNGNDAELWAEVKDVKDDYLECYLVNPIDYVGDKEVNVAKPEWLRKTPYHGKSVKFKDGMIVAYAFVNAWTRTATVTAGGSGVFTEMITPNYSTRADNILEGRVGHGGLITIKPRNTGVLDLDGNAVTYLEIVGANGRDWAVRP